MIILKFINNTFFKLIIILSFLGLISAWLLFGDRGFIHLQKLEKEKQVYLEKIDLLEKANQELMNEINKFRNDKEYKESLVKRNLGMIKENETIYMFRDDEDSK